MALCTHPQSLRLRKIIACVQSVVPQRVRSVLRARPLPNSGVDRGRAAELLETLPPTLAATDESQRTLLQRLFQPQPATAELFDLLWVVRSARGKERVKAVMARLADRGVAPRSWMWPDSRPRFWLPRRPWPPTPSRSLVALGRHPSHRHRPCRVDLGYKVRECAHRSEDARRDGTADRSRDFHGLCNGSTPADLETRHLPIGYIPHCKLWLAATTMRCQ